MARRLLYLRGQQEIIRMQFAGKVWRLLVGIKDGLVLVFMLLFFSAPVG